jgi:hypothetical protein
LPRFPRGAFDDADAIEHRVCRTQVEVEPTTPSASVFLDREDGR